MVYSESLIMNKDKTNIIRLSTKTNETRELVDHIKLLERHIFYNLTRNFHINYLCNTVITHQ